MIHYKSIDQSQFAEGTDIKEQERVFDDFLQDTLLEIQGSHINKTTPYIFLRTCNRSEIYYGEGEVPDEVARHLFRVVSGLESAIVGERAVQGQVKEAYYTAKAQRPLTAELHRLFQSALQVGKRVRNETEISHGAVSHSLAALEIIESLGNVDVRNARITLIGVNKLTSDILKFLQNKGAKMVFLANRSQIKAHYLADPLGIKVYTLDEKQEFLAHTDILISATSAPHLIIRKEDIPEQKSLLAIDLAFPRDIDSRLSELPNVQLYNIRDVERKVRENIEVRGAEVEKAEAIIKEEIQEMQEALERRKKFLEVKNEERRVKKQRSAAEGKANSIALLFIKFKVQCSKFKVTSSMFKVQSNKFKVQSNKSSENISQRIFYLLIGLAVLVFGLFFLVGYDMPFVENPDFNAPLFTDVLIVLMWLFLIGGVGLAVYSMIKGYRTTKSEAVVNGVPVRRIFRITWLSLLAILVVTFLLGGSDPMLINGENYADWIWLKLSDMFVVTSLLMLMAGIGAVCFGGTRYIRKKK